MPPLPIPAFQLDNHMVFEVIMALLVALGGLHLRYLMLTVQKNQSEMYAKIDKQQTDVKAELLLHQNNIKEELTRYNSITAAGLQTHVQEDALQFRFITETLKRIEDNQRGRTDRSGN